MSLRLLKCLGGAVVKHGGGLHTCESCGRIIFYNPPVSFEGEVQQSQSVS